MCVSFVRTLRFGTPYTSVKYFFVICDVLILLIKRIYFGNRLTLEVNGNHCLLSLSVALPVVP